MIDPELEKFLTEWARQWSSLSANDPVTRRAHFEIVAANMALPKPDGVDEKTEIWIPSESGAVRVRVFRSIAGGDAQACLIYMHGGAFMQGSPETHADITSRIAAANGQTVVSVDYALAPEHPFPAAVTQCTDVVRYVHQNAAELGIDPQRIVVGGDSAGANLAAVLALIFRQDPSVRLTGQLLIYPPVDFERQRPSYVENANAPLLQTAGMAAVNAMYCPNPSDLKSPLAAPMLAPDHSGLPPAFIGVAENDPLRDDGVDYAAVLERAGVAVVLDRGAGLTHGYLRAMDYCRASREKLAAMSAWLDQINRTGSSLPGD